MATRVPELAAGLCVAITHVKIGLAWLATCLAVGGAQFYGQVPRLARLVVAGLALGENLARDSRPQGFEVGIGIGVLAVHCFLPS